jgi:Fe-S-cluster containining protein
MEEMQTVHLQMTVEGTTIEAAVPLPAKRGPRRVLLPVLQRLTDTIVQIAENGVLASGESISCRKGCDACCRQMVPISPAEAFALGEVLQSMPARQQARTLARFESAREMLAEKGVLERLERRGELSADELKQLDRDYFAAGVSCPFLQNRACSIHTQRPLACREFLVTSPAEACRNPGAGEVRQVVMAAKVSVALAEGDQSGWLPLVLARQYVAGHREAVMEASPAEVLGRILRAL